MPGSSAAKVITLGLLLLNSASSFAQAEELYDLKRRLMDGDKGALREIAPYFDSSRVVVEFLGYHRLEVELSSIAKRIVLENTVFGPEAITVSHGTTARQLTDFLDQHRADLEFSELAGAFLVVPLEQQRIVFAVRNITPARKTDVDARSAELTGQFLFDNMEVRSLIHQHDPRALLAVASALYRARCRHNSYFFKVTEVLDLLRHLTGEEVGFDYGDGRIVWDVGDVCPTDMEWSLLVYYAQHFSRYQWDGKRGLFHDPTVKTEAIGEVENWFQLLGNANDSLALDAFTRLTQADTTKVVALAQDYEKADIDHNRNLPIFTYRFLPQLVRLTAYCSAEGIDHLGGPELRSAIDRLRDWSAFPERRRLEDSLIASLPLNDITAFEYWAIVHETSWPLTYSAGRILDLFYSRHWKELVQSDEQLKYYLKKSALFNRLGIIGVCNNYLDKFDGASDDVLRRLEALVSSDPDIERQRDRVRASHGALKMAEPEGEKYWAGNHDREAPDLESRMAALTSRTQDLEKNQDTLCELLSMVRYDQIPAALRAIEPYAFKYAWQKYGFMEKDWGFFMLGDFDEASNRDLFLQVYDSLTQYGLYAWQLDLGGIDYKHVDGSLNLDRIYELLKYDVVEAFVGGGGGAQDNEVYALVKLLELTYGTTLGFPKKRCNSDQSWGCTSEQRAQTWMRYLTDQHLLQRQHDDPPSFH